jgi:hypothetical protein
MLDRDRKDKKKLFAIATTVVLIASAACTDSDGPAGPDGAETALTAAEASALAGLFALDAMSAAEGQGPGGAAATTAEAVPFSFDVAVSLPCPLGGRVALDGSMNGEFDADAQSLQVSVTATQVHSSCAVDAEGVTVTVTGNPGIELETDLEVAGDPPQGTHTAVLTGGFDWVTSDGREGTCSIDVSASFDLGDDSGTSSGQICGYDVNASIG